MRIIKAIFLVLLFLILVFFLCIMPFLLYKIKNINIICAYPTFISGVCALGTMGATLIAIFSLMYDKWFNKPSLKLSTSKEKPYCIDICNNNNDKSIEICGCITNDSLNNAENCQVICEEIHGVKSNGKIDEHLLHFRPINFPWCNNNIINVNISTNMQMFFKIAELSNNDIGKNDPNLPVTNTINLNICANVNDNYFYTVQPTNQIVIIILRIISTKSNDRYGIKIKWNGKCLDDYYDNATTFSIEVLNNKDLRKL